MEQSVTSRDIGLKIKALRQQAGLSQERLAEMVGVTFQQIQKYENGQTILNVTKLQVIAQALKVSAVDFFTTAPTQGARLTEEEDCLLQAFRKVKSGELRECILTLVGNMNRRVR